jgi:uncharacterized membrane protein YozB (DUF420 family)
MTYNDLPALNALLNGTSAVLLSFGLYHIKAGRQNSHRNCMLAACVTSLLFLTSYVTYHMHAGRTVFKNPEWFRPIYLALLLTHTVLAVVILPMVLLTLVAALRGRFERHKKIARWTWPFWMYVSVTGVVIYLLLYQIFPQH